MFATQLIHNKDVTTAVPCRCALTNPPPTVLSFVGILRLTTTDSSSRSNPPHVNTGSDMPAHLPVTWTTSNAPLIHHVNVSQFKPSFNCMIVYFNDIHIKVTLRKPWKMCSMVKKLVSFCFFSLSQFRRNWKKKRENENQKWHFACDGILPRSGKTSF